MVQLLSDFEAVHGVQLTSAHTSMHHLHISLKHFLTVFTELSTDTATRDVKKLRVSLCRCLVSVQLICVVICPFMKNDRD